MNTDVGVSNPCSSVECSVPIWLAKEGGSGTMEAVLVTKAAALRQLVGALGRAAVAYSGGVDSTLLLAVCREVLGREGVLALTVQSELVPAAEVDQAAALAGQLDVRHLLVPLRPLDVPEIAANLPDRCYHCKRLLFGRLLDIARAEGFPVLLHGANLDDSGDYRPGMRAAEELGVRAPLLEVGLFKSDVRALSRKMALPTWNHPAMACLASRIPYGTALSPEALARIEAAETWLRARLHLAQLRVRDHFPMARLEVPADDVARLAQPGVREEIAAHLRGLGYQYVALDLEGFRSGSLNAELTR